MPVSPYRGAEYYRTEDRHLFFGRLGDATAVLGVVTCERLALLHAVSGAGKTSLLNALVIPEIEERGGFAVRSTPEQHPTDALRRATTLRVLPPPSAEIAAIDRLVEAMARHAASSDPTLIDAKRWFSDGKCLSRSSEDYFALQSPVELASDVVGEPIATASGGDRPSAVPFVVRSLQLERGPWQLARHILAFERLSSKAFWRATTSEDLVNELAQTPISHIRAFFAAPERYTIWHELISYFMEPNLTLRTFFERLGALWGRHLESFSVVLILDQFEELFTRFVDQRRRGSAAEPDLPDWTLRSSFFADLGQLLGREEIDPEPHDVYLPVRILLSMRDDYIADLDQLAPHTGPIPDSARFHLGLLRKADVGAVIRKPAEIFSYRYDDRIFAALVADLPEEEDKIAPGHVQIICDRLWEAKGRELANRGDLSAIPFETFRDLGGTEGILKGHFQRLLDGLTDERDKIDVLGMLEPLITVGRRRNIVERERLERPAFRRPQRRRELIEHLRREHILRVEWRLGGAFAELAHEFLIQPILDAQVRLLRDPTLRERAQALNSALARLLDLHASGFRESDDPLLNSQERAALEWYWDRLDTDTSPWITEVVYRSAIRDGADDEELRRLTERLDERPVEISCSSLESLLSERRDASRWFDGLELDTLAAEADWRAYPAERRRFILESQLRTRHGDPDHDYRRWIEGTEP